MSPLRLRIGDYATLAWLAVVATVYTAYGRWGELRLLRESTRYNPLVLLVLLTLCRYLLPLLVVSVRRLAATAALLAGSASGAGAEPDPGQERALLRRMGLFLRDAAPVYLVLGFYPSTDTIVDCLQGTRLLDRQLAAADVLLFGGHASVWAERLVSPRLTDVLSLFYFLHLVMPMVVLLFLAFRAPRALFVEAVQGLVTILAVGMALYVLVPAEGPGRHLAHLYSRDLAGGLVGQVNDALIEATRVPRDAFPSMHVGLSALLLVYAFRGRTWFGLLVLPFAVGNWLATVYLRYHYLVDVVAGFLLVAVVYAAVGWWMRRFPVEEPPDASGGMG